MAIKVGFQFEIEKPQRRIIWGDWLGIFLALPESDAHRLHSVMTATTWGELEQKMDGADYEELIRSRFGDGERPLPEDRFDPPTGEFADFEDPRALMLELLPEDVLALGETSYTPEGEIVQLDIAQAETALLLLAKSGWMPTRDDATVAIWMGG